MAIPAFRHMGGKARLRKWLIGHFPSSGISYSEPFCGKGNVFFAAYPQLSFGRWLLSDLDARFLIALLVVDVEELPDEVSRDSFVEWRNRAVRDDVVALVLEPRITFAGKGYRAGFSGSSGTHVGYSKAAYSRVIAAAQESLRQPNVTVLGCDWLDNLNTLGPNDFAYLDPPYYGTSAAYDNISHETLVARLNTAAFRWAVSGYASPLYDNELRYCHRYVCERNSEIKSSNARRRTPVNEILWTSY